tara:strand:+ start:1263 stop:2117 length:855 start_codon:yes stop_codon:yes gene_type:complete
MKIESGYVSDQEEKRVISSIRTQRFKSRFKFLNGHDGQRPGELSCIIGPKGGSKSTLTRSIMIENAMSGKIVLIILSEESVSTYRLEVNRAMRRVCPDKIKSDMFMENIFFVTLLGTNYGAMEPFKKDFDEVILNINPDIIYFDNFTTSFICSLPFFNQSIAVNYFKSIATRFDIPFILVIHTAKGTDIYKQLVEGDNVRGDATTVNFGSYNYIVSTFFRLHPVRSFVFIDKARYHSNMNKKVYELDFDTESGIYISDRLSSLEDVAHSMKTGSIATKLKGDKF